MRAPIFLSLAAIASSKAASNDVTDRISHLLTQVRSKQWASDVTYWPEFAYPPVKWSEQGGLYESNVHVNFGGNPLFKAARNDYHFPDSNGFVTMFMLDALLETQEFGAITVNENEAVAAVNAILSHMDPNLPPQSGVYNFWNMKCDKDTRLCVGEPPNITIPLSKVGSGLQFIVKGLEKLGLGKVAETLDTIANFPDSFIHTFRIPSDADDTGCALALGARLVQSQASVPFAAHAWKSAHGDLSLVMDRLMEYSYKPFSQDVDDALIDPRSYFWMHKFLQQEAKRAENPTFEVFTTWLQATSEIKLLKDVGNNAPFNVNNVDASVAANALHGFIGAALTDPEGVLPLLAARPAFVNLMEGTGRLLSFVVTDNVLSSRPDLVLLYYPPIYDYYWFVARTVNLLENPPSPLPDVQFPIFSSLRDSLGAVMRGPATDQILAAAQSNADKSQVWWDDFLGHADTDISGKATPAFEDRVFSTAVALNALVDTWTETSASSASTLVGAKRELQWKDAAPAAVKAAVKAGVQFLMQESDNFPKENAFFSASVKGVTALPFWYPTNVLEDLDGVKHVCDGPSPTPTSTSLIPGVFGLMTDEEFQGKIQTGCFKTPTPLEKLNMAKSPFPYWSSPPLTNALEMLLLAKFQAIKEVAPAASDAVVQRLRAEVM